VSRHFSGLLIHLEPISTYSLSFKNRSCKPKKSENNHGSFVALELRSAKQILRGTPNEEDNNPPRAASNFAQKASYCNGWIERKHNLHLEKAGSFPHRVKLSVRAMGWLSADIERWLADRAAERAA